MVKNICVEWWDSVTGQDLWLLMRPIWENWWFAVMRSWILKIEIHFFFFFEIVTDLLKRKWDGKYLYMQGLEAGAAGKWPLKEGLPLASFPMWFHWSPIILAGWFAYQRLVLSTDIWPDPWVNWPKVWVVGWVGWPHPGQTPSKQIMDPSWLDRAGTSLIPNGIIILQPTRQSFQKCSQVNPGNALVVANKSFQGDWQNCKIQIVAAISPCLDSENSWKLA